MGAVRTTALAGLRRRRLQTLVIALVVFLSTSAATLALATLVESQAPFDRAFADGNGAHLVIAYDGQVSPAQLAATTSASGVTETAGPWPVGELGFLMDPGDVAKGGLKTFGDFAASGRSRPDTSVDRMTLSAGRWWQAPGEIVLSQSAAKAWQKQVGDTVDVQQASLGKGPGTRTTAGPTAPGPTPGSRPPLVDRTFTVVGIAGSISTPDVKAWLSPADLAALSPGQTLALEMLYRVTPAATASDLATAAVAVTHGIDPAGVIDSQSYLAHKAEVDSLAGIFVPILLAFALFALLAAAFIIANVVSGIVLASYRNIGVMKAIGFTRLQVVAILLLEILVPVAVGAVLGVAVGTLASQPILAQTAQAFGLPAPFSLSLPVVVVVLFAAASVAVLAAIGPAMWAGRLSAVAAITHGLVPSSRAGGGQLWSVVMRAPLATSLRLGMAGGLARLLPAALRLGALVVGVAALVFALALDGSLRLVAADLIRDQASPIRMELQQSSPTVSATIAADRDVARFVAIEQEPVTVPQLHAQVPFVAYEGDSSWLGYALIHGRWFSTSGEVVAPTNFFVQSGLHLGDTLTVTFQGRPMALTLVGEIFDQPREGRDGLVLRGDWADLAAVDSSLAPSSWEVLPRAGVSLAAFRSALGDATNHVVSISLVEDSSTDSGFLLFEGVISFLGIVLVGISLGSVFNIVLLEARRRARETAVLKTIGMTPRQVVTMVIVSIVPVGLVAGVVGVPVGLALQRIVLGFMAQAAAKTDIPASALDVFSPTLLLALALAGVAIGALGAYLPTQRAAGSPIAPVLQAE